MAKRGRGSKRQGQSNGHASCDLEVWPPVEGPGAFLDSDYLESMRSVLLPILKQAEPNDFCTIKLSVRWYGTLHSERKGVRHTDGWFVVTAKRIEFRSDIQLATWSKVAWGRSFGKAKLYYISGGIESSRVLGIDVALESIAKVVAAKAEHRQTETKRRVRLITKHPQNYFGGNLAYGRKITIATDSKGRPSTGLSVERRRYGKVIVKRRIRANGKYYRKGARIIWREGQS